ncbi:MAG TPA: DegV family protein [Acidimicrobiales bacterium]|nr:DegV family protein [Acidimicrobiales bacterium]
MPGIKVVTDSACDLPSQLVEERGIALVPLTIRFGTEEFVDQTDLSTKEFWDRVTTGDVMPETAAPSPGAFQAAFLQAAEEGAEAVACVTLSSGVSATYQSACTAAEAVADRIRVSVTDTQSMTMGQGFMVLAAADMADAGTGIDEIEAELARQRDRIHVFGVIDSLDFLKRGGRIGGAAHLMGSLLSIKPVIEIRNGVVEVESKQRTRSRSLQYMAGKARDAGPLRRLAVANGIASDIDEVIDALSGCRPTHDLVVTTLGPVIGAHGGPGTIGLCFELGD